MPRLEHVTSQAYPFVFRELTRDESENLIEFRNKDGDLVHYIDKNGESNRPRAEPTEFDPREYADGIGTGGDDTAAFQWAFAAGSVKMPADTTFHINGTLRLRDGQRVRGDTGDDSNGTVLIHTVEDGTPLFDSDPTTGLSGCVVEDIQCKTLLSPQSSAGAGDCFNLYAPCNASAFRRIWIHNFKGNGFNISPASNGDPHCMFNTIFEQPFVLGCGGYAFNCLGDAQATWISPDFSRMGSGGFYFKDGGGGNQNGLIFVQPEFEFNASSAGAQAFVFDNMNGYAPLILSPVFNGPGTGDAILIKGAIAAHPTILAPSGYAYTNLLNDTTTPFTIPYSNSTFFYGQPRMQQVKVSGPGALRDLNDTAGTSGKRWLRELMTAGLLVVSHRADDGSGGGEIYRIDMGNGIFSHSAAMRTLITTPTYSASITPDASLSNWQTITVTNGTAFTINAPTNPPAAAYHQEFTIEISNSAGGAMGVITWNAIFKLVGGAFVNPANTFKRFIRFEWNGTNWIETSRSGADY